jgi:hypothetical protein
LNTPFPVNLSERDVAGLRSLYLGEIPRGVGKSYRESESEKTWLEVFSDMARLGI